MRARQGVVVLVIAMAALGCGVAPGQPGLPTASVPASEGTSPTPASGQPASVPGCPNYVIAPETGPLPSDLTEEGPVAQAQARLENDIALAQQYTAAHPEDFGSIRFENAPRVRIVIGFTANLETHCAALRDRLEFPDEFEIIWSPRTSNDLEGAMNEIIEKTRDHLVSAAGGIDTIELTLMADSEALAAEIAAEYGDLVDIRVGMLSYPDRTLPSGFDCGSLMPEPAVGLPLRATVKRLSPVEVRSGASFEGDVTVLNFGSTAFDFESGRPLTALVSGPDGSVPIGGYVGGIAGTGAGALIEPGGTYDMDFLCGTASCDPAVGYAVPPGEAFVVVPVDVYKRSDPNGPPEILKLMSEPMPIRIVP